VLLNKFQEGISHFAMVKKELKDCSLVSDNESIYNIGEDKMIGIITLEDVFEEILREEILDE